jgi:hypothetical protein
MDSEKPTVPVDDTYHGDVKAIPARIESDLTDEQTLDGPRPTGWMHRERKIGKFSLSWYASPRTQLVMVSFVCFLCPGMFNALGGLGGGGKTDATLADNMVSTHVSQISKTVE